MTPHDLDEAIAGLNSMLTAGRIDFTFGPDGPDRIVGIAHELLDDGTDREAVVVHAPTYGQAQVELYAELVHAGFEAVAVS